MDDCNNIKHKLTRDGYSQLDREYAALLPSSVKVDGRELSDILQFIYQYARQINYYEEDSHKRTGDWVPFFRNSVPFQYAVIGAYDLEKIEERFQTVDIAIRSRLTFESLNLLFDLIFDMTDQLGQWIEHLKNDTSGLKRSMENLIETNLSTQFKQLVKLANSAGKWSYKRAKDGENLQNIWLLNTTDLYGVDTTILIKKGSLKHKVLNARSILEELYRTFWKGMQMIISIANDEEQLEKSLFKEDEKNHEPHLGLLFAFLMLFKQAQGGLNELSEAHLNFFYRKTLQLKEQEILPDHAHLTFELAKKVEEDILIEKGTRFKAGKDEKGKEIFFELDEEVIITKAKVADLRTLFIDRIGENQYAEEINKVEGIYMSPIANSADGKGEGFAKDQEARWETVGSKESKWIDPDVMPAEIENHPYARLGFMIASKILFLREGTRAISLILTLDNVSELGQDLPAGLFNIFVTTEKGWLPVEVPPPSIMPTVDTNSKTITINFTLPTDFPEVISSDATLLETDYGKDLPMIKFELNQEIIQNAADYYRILRQKNICKIEIRVEACDVRQLVIQNDLSVLDINKPFMPFGALPKKNSSNFYIGSEEIFCKRWERIEVSPVWKDLPKNQNQNLDFPGYYSAYPQPPRPASNNDFIAEIKVLADKNWNSHGNRTLFNASTSVLCSTTDMHWAVQRVSEAEICTDLPDLQNGYQTDTACGFLKLKLGSQDFLHDEYANTLIENVGNFAKWPELKEKIIALKNTANTLKIQTDNTHNSLHTIYCNNNGGLENFTTSITDIHTTQGLANNAKSDTDGIASIINTIIPLPNASYTPLIESLSLNYSAQTSTDYENEIFFTHLHPYKGTYECLDVDNNCENTILPCFVDEGTLYLGIQNYNPGNNLNLFFQMESASADPDMNKAIVCWEYLRDNQWKPLLKDTNVLSDTTNGLIQSGIVKLSIPSDISNKETTILPPNLHWLKARVLFRTAAISETISVQTQSARVTFSPEIENDLSRLSSPLDAMKIAKFESPKAAIKAVQQNYSGFRGRAEEESALFYQRISEHLRHKGRAITLYDYERLILQHFENIYKVKCITHTLGRRGEDSDIEMAPGFVTIVVVLDLNKINAVDPLQPKIPAATLEAVKKMLRLRISPFIKIEVLNPIYETIEVRAEVMFRTGKSKTFYAKKLAEDVRKFLAPWAYSDTRHDISFGGKIYYSTVLKFIEDRPYVDYLVNLRMKDKDGNLKTVIYASNTRVVLTSGQHQFEPIETTNDNLIVSSAYSSTQIGIGYSKIPEE